MQRSPPTTLVTLGAYAHRGDLRGRVVKARPHPGVALKSTDLTEASGNIHALHRRYDGVLELMHVQATGRGIVVHAANRPRHHLARTVKSDVTPAISIDDNAW